MTLDLTKPVKTRGGRDVRIIPGFLSHDTYPVLGVVTREDGSQHAETYTLGGKSYEHDSDTDSDNLVNVPERGYKLVFDDGYIVPQGLWLPSKESFDVGGSGSFTKAGRVGFLVKGGDFIVFEAL